MKRIICIVLAAAVVACTLTACGSTVPSANKNNDAADVKESLVNSDETKNTAEVNESAADSNESSNDVQDGENSADDKENVTMEEKTPFYTPSDQEKELICNYWYRGKSRDDGDMDIYWLQMGEDGYCHFAHETRDTKEYIDKLDGTWKVDEHGYAVIDLGKYSGRFRFLKNSYGSTNIICIDGDDFVESGANGAYAAFVPVKWYKGNLRFVEPSATGAENDAEDANAADAEPADADAADNSGTDMTYIEIQGEGDEWFRLAGSNKLCKIDVDTKEGEFPGRIAVNQNDYYVVKIQQYLQQY